MITPSRRLVVRTGTGSLPVMKEVPVEDKRRKIELLIMPTEQAIKLFKQSAAQTNAILHVTC